MTSLEFLRFLHFASRRVVVCAFFGAVALVAHAADTAASDPEADEFRAAHAHAMTFWYDPLGKPRTLDGPACARELEKVQAIAERRPDLAPMYYSLYSECKFFDPKSNTALISEPDLYRWFSPWLEAQAKRKVDAADPQAFLYGVTSEVAYMRIAIRIGLVFEGEARYLEILRGRIARATGPNADTVADRELRALSRSLYGTWQLQGTVIRIQQTLEQGLGPGHRASLMMLRAAAYHERYLGRAQQALDFISRAGDLSAQHHPDDALLQAHMASEWSACLANAGRHAEAITKMLQSRAYFEAQVPVPWTSVMRTNYNLAGTALDMGDYPAAITYAERAIDFAMRSGDIVLSKSEIVVPATIKAQSKLAMGDPNGPAELKAALLLIQHPDMHIGSQAFALVRDAVQRGDEDMLAWASDYTDLHIQRFRSPLQAESALRPLMQAWKIGGASLADTSVREPLEKALAIGLGGRNPGTAALTQFGMARHLAHTRPSTAIWLYKRAANVLQTMRQGMPTDDQDLYRSWLSNYEPELRVFVALLIDEGRLAEAEQALALLRDEELFEYSRRSAARRSGPPTPLSFTRAEQRANPTMAELVEDAEASAKVADTVLDNARVDGFRTDYRDPLAEERTQALQGRLHTLLETALPAAQIPDASAVPQSQAPPMPRHAARLTYLVGRNHLDIVVTVGRQSYRQRVDVKATELNQHIQAARSALSNAQVDPNAALARLWQWLIEPVRHRLQQDGVQRLVLVPDGALRYLPFAALFDGNRYLVQHYALQTQLGTTTRISPPQQRQAPSRSAVLALGRTAGDARHSALPGVASELQAIRAPNLEVLLDGAFTSANLRAGLHKGPNIVHMASHFVLDPAGEDKSYMLLGDGQRLSLTELKTLPWQGVRLALLSACDSAVPVQQGDGREWMGFAQSLGTAGVKDILATLWRIDDAATADWMRSFYGRMRTPRDADVNPATLAAVQRAWLQRYRGNALAHPHYWAAFVWMGT